MYRGGSTLEDLFRLHGRVLDHGELFVQRREPCQNLGQRRSSIDWLEDQTILIPIDDDFFCRQFEFARYADCLIPAVPK